MPGPEEIVVSICCVTYNQRDYIADAIEGFLVQETTFPFEILINDDCSTDGTTAIVERYAHRYPDKIRVVTHERNMFSLGCNITTDFLYPLVRGRYVAFCEGDDYWTDLTKLQRQFDAMEANPQSALCVHASDTVVADTGRLLTVNRPFDHDCEVPLADIFERRHSFATASQFMRKSAYESYIAEGMPNVSGDGDFKMLAYYATLGPVLYLERSMTAYRVFAKNSINRSIAKTCREEQERIQERIRIERIGVLHHIDEMTDGRYHREVLGGILRADYAYLKGIADLPRIKKRFPDFYAQEPRMRKLILFARCHMPRAYTWVARRIYHL